MSVISRRQRLRCATQPAHRRLDLLIDQAGFLDSRSRYATYLRATWSARWPLEQALDLLNLAGTYAAWPDRRICADLLEDISDVSEAELHKAEETPFLLHNQAEALGVLYVLEGSALGARLLKIKAEAIGMTPSCGARHMARQTMQPQAWLNFTELLDGRSLAPSDNQLCIEGAVATFAHFERIFRQAAAPWHR